MWNRLRYCAWVTVTSCSLKYSAASCFRFAESKMISSTILIIIRSRNSKRTNSCTTTSNSAKSSNWVSYSHRFSVIWITNSVAFQRNNWAIWVVLAMKMKTRNRIRNRAHHRLRVRYLLKARLVPAIKTRMTRWRKRGMLAEAKRYYT